MPRPVGLSAPAPSLTHPNPMHHTTPNNHHQPQALQAIRAMTNCLDAHARGAAPLLLPALPQLCQRLRAVDDLDLAEQCMRWCVQTLALVLGSLM